MPDIEFDWDEAKSRANIVKHGVSFEEAASAFEDENGVLIDDPAHSKSEDRFILLGMSQRARILVVVHCYRNEDAVIRLISARRATTRERRQYGDQP